MEVFLNVFRCTDNCMSSYKPSVMPLHFFGSTSTIRRFGERFCDGQYSLVSFLFDVLLTLLPEPSHLGACVPSAL